MLFGLYVIHRILDALLFILLKLTLIKKGEPHRFDYLMDMYLNYFYSRNTFMQYDQYYKLNICYDRQHNSVSCDGDARKIPDKECLRATINMARNASAISANELTELQSIFDHMDHNSSIRRLHLT